MDGVLLWQNVDVYDDEDDEDDDGCDDEDSDEDCDSDDGGIVYRSADLEAGGGTCSHKLQRCTWHSANGGGSTLIL